jgi:predicted O-methyltransferase YrrM
MDTTLKSHLTARSTQADNHDRSRFTFQEGWFELIRSEWEELTASLRGKKLHILEVGSFEGASATWILDNLMSHPESTMTVIDTFEGGMEHQDTPDHVHKYDITTLESRFRANVAKCEHVSKLRVIKARSDDALLALRQESAQFDFIYVDASHVAIDVLHDAVVCWRMLNVHGIMVFDDFRWKGYMEDCYNPRVAIIGFLRCAAPEVETKETESQMWVTKVPNHIPATPNPNPDLYYWEKDNSSALP